MSALGPALRWAIVGGGTAGLAAALFLARAGHEVVLFERVASPEPVGAGILIQPTGMAVLRELGLEWYRRQMLTSSAGTKTGFFSEMALP